MIFRSVDPPVLIPDTALTPFLLERAAKRPEKAAFIDGPTGRIVTYREWGESVERAAAGLAARGFRKGDVFAIYSANVPEYAVAFHAVSLLGGINTTINPTYTIEELRAQVEDSGARYLLTAASCVDKVEQATHQSPLREVFVIDAPARLGIPFASLFSREGTPPPVDIDPREDVVALPYSSGTTGLPKGVMLTHRNLVSNIVQTASVLDIGEGDTVLGLLPFFHIYGMNVIMNLSLYAGSTVVTMPRFDLEQFLEVLQKYCVTYAYVVPPIVLALAKSPLVSRYNLTSLRQLFSGAAPLSDTVADAAAARLGCPVRQGYGLTETSPVTHAARPGAAASAGSIGPPVANTEVKIVDVVSHAELGPTEEGEIWVRGPQVMKGYWRRPDATAEMIDEDGWLHTGDVGFADDQGRFFIVDRLKELIKYKGMPIAPAELEALLIGHPSIADAAVIPLENEEAGQVPMAFVVLKDDLPPADILEYVAARVAPYKRLRSIAITDSIPKSPSGKILRRVLVERQRSASHGRPT